MAKFKEYQEKLKKKSKVELLKSMFQSMAITVTAVVAVVVLVPTSPKAAIDDIQAYTNEIIYHVDVTDVDNAIYPGTLKVVLENQFEYYETCLELGKNSGIFRELNANTMYNLKVMADKGFGMENLASSKIWTETRVGGGIIGYSLLTPPEEYLLNYEIELFLSDPEAEFRSIQLRYGTLYSGETEVTDYQTIPLAVTDTSVTIPYINNNNLKVFLILEGIRLNDEIVELDTFDFTTPFRLYASMDVMQVDNRQISVSVYKDSESSVDATYELILKRNKETIARRVVESDTSEMMHYENIEVFTGLVDDVEYTIELICTYTHPYWLTREIASLQTLSVTTLPDFDHQVNIEEFETDYQVEIILTDPGHNFQIGYYIIYQIEAEYEFYYEGSEFGFTPNGEQKTTIMTIDKPLIDDYRIEIGVRSQTTYYEYSILENIKPNE